MQGNKPVCRQEPRRKAGSEGIPGEQGRAPCNEETTAPAVDADTAKHGAPRKKTDGAGGVASADSKSLNSKVVPDASIVPPLAIALVVAIAVGLSGDDGSNVVEVEDVTMSTSPTPVVEPTDYDGAEASASLYYEFALTGHKGDQEDIYDTCAQLVLSEIRVDEDTFYNEVIFGESGEIGDEAVEVVLDDPEDFLEDYGYATTTSTTTITGSLTCTPSPTYQEPEPTYEEPSDSDGNADAEANDGGRQLAW